MGIVVSFAAVTLRRLHAEPMTVAFVALGSCIANLTTLFWAYMSAMGDKLLWSVIPTIFSRGILILSVFVIQPGKLTVLLFIYFLAESVSITPYSAVMKQVYPDEFRNQAMGYVRALGIGATLAGYAIGGQLLDTGIYSYRWVFPLGASMGVLSSLIFWMIKINSPEKGPKKFTTGLTSVSHSVKNITTSPTLIYIFFVEFIIGLANLIGIGVYPLFQVDILKLSNSAVGLLGIVSSIGGMIFLYLWGRMNVGRVRFSSFQKLLCFIPFIPFFYSISHNIYPLFISSILAGICWNGWDILWFNYLLQSTGDDKISSGYIGVRYTLLGVRSLLTPLILSFFGTNIRLATYFATGLAVFGLVLLFRLNDDSVSKSLKGRKFSNGY